MNLHGTLNSNKITTYFHFNARNIPGTGLTSGNLYTGVESETYVANEPSAGSKATYAYAFRQKMISTGNLSDMIRIENFHITYNPDGNVTVFHGDQTGIECH